MPAKFPHFLLISVLVLSLLVDYEDIVEYISTTDIGMDFANVGMCQSILIDETLFLFGVHHYWGCTLEFSCVLHWRVGLTSMVFA